MKQDKKINFIQKAKQIHKDKYNYSKVDYKNNNTKICIICPEHGEFWQIPKNHLKGCGCKKCSNKVYDTESFKNEAKNIHEDKYNYSKVEYKKSIEKVCIICPEHGEFWQTPHMHLRGSGCPKCGKEKQIEKQTLTKEEFIRRARQIHGWKYNYSKVEYINYHTKICIICPEHGEFWQTPAKHLIGHACPKCAGNEILSNNEFIEKVKQVHGDKYDYSKSDYERSQFKVTIICPKHGDFRITPNNLLRGRGCPICKESTLERKVRVFLEKNNIIFEYQKNFEWLGSGKNKQKLDFYLPEYNIAIECQGEQHFKPISFGSKKQDLVEKRFKHIKELDEKKFNQCKLNNLNLYYINYNESDEEIFKKLKKMTGLFF